MFLRLHVIVVTLSFEVVEKGRGLHRVYAVSEGRRVSWLTILDLYFHYGESRIRVGGVAGVYTPREFRRRGYSRATIEYALKWMEENGYPLTALFGIQEYYHKFGYATFMGEHVATITLRDASRAVRGEGYEVVLTDDPGYRSREIAELYEENNRSRIASRVREPGEWRGFRKGVSWEHEPKVLALEHGCIVGYAALERWPSPEELVVAEVGAVEHDYRVYESLLAELYETALSSRKSVLKFYLPPDHPMIEVLIAHGCRVESTYPWSGGGMARVVGLREMFEEILPELEPRSRGIEGSLEVRVPGERVVLKVSDGSVELLESGESSNVVELDQGLLAQLVLGYRSLGEASSKISFKGSGARILHGLFRKAAPYVWQPDRW